MGAAVELVLASASPRRRDLLAAAGIAFRAAPVEVDEDRAAADRPALHGAEAAEALARELALRKALARAALEPGEARVLGSDTVVVAPDGALLGKPATAAEARSMAARLSACVHEVITAVAVVDARTGAARARAVRSRVRFRELTPGDLDAHAASGLWQGKAGGYGAQDHPSLVAEVEGSFTNVVGLPMEGLAEMF